MKRFFLSLLVPLFGLPAFAQSDGTNPTPAESLDFTVDGIVYTILNEQEKTCQTKAGTSYIDYTDRKIVTVYGNSKSGAITIPATVQKTSASGATESYTVVAIGNYGFDQASSVTIASGGVTTIGDFAFMNDMALTSVSLPEGITSIGRSAFYNCTGLKSINLPTSLSNIAAYTFSYTGLTSVTIPGHVATIGENAFAYCTSLKSVSVPGSVIQLGKSVFQGCTALSTLSLQEGISSIPAYAFSGCNALTSLTIPASVSSIGDYGFNCSGLTSVTSLSKTIPVISSNSFSNATYSNAVLKVYKTALSNYQNSSLWGQFARIELINEPATGLTITPSTLNINVGLTGKLSAALTPEEATGDIVWSVLSASPANCIEIDPTGLVTAKQIGTGRVIAESGSLTAACDVIVSANPDEAVIINSPSDDIYIGDSVALSAAVFPTTITPSLTWTSSNTDVASIDSKTGVLKALSDGATVITATNDNVSGSITITVKPIEAQSVVLSQQNITLKVGASQTLTATVVPANTTYKNVTWDSNDPNIVVVSNGVVTAMGVGTASIRAMVGQATANCTVTVEPIEAQSVTLSTNSASLKIGQSLQLGAIVNPDNTTDKTITWTSSNAECATVSMEGEVLAIAEGVTTVTATCGTVSASCTITVMPIESEEVVLNYTALTLKIGNSQQLAATVYPANTTNPTLTWTTSSPGVATVENGLVTAVSVGKTTITVSNGAHSASCVVTVEPILVEQVLLQESSITINVGTPFTLIASVMPENATDKTVVWNSLNPNVAKVSGGVVSGIAPGSTVITASSGSANASCVVSVLQPATSITLNKSNLDLFVGDMFDLIETVMPANTTDQVSWTSSDENVATVDNNGIVTAIKSGSATITATCGTKTATCKVTVSDIAAASVILDASELNLISGQSHQLTATVLPENTTFPIVAWTSSDPKVATVAEDGTVTAVAAGNATITAACGEAKASCMVNVTRPASNEVVLNYKTYSLKATETVQLEVINPANVDASAVTWSSADTKVATVSAEGLVRALAVGETTITASYNGSTASCVITVAPTYAENVALNASELIMEIDDVYQLRATVLPAAATNQTVVWSSSNPDVAMVSEDGEVTAMAPGVATVTAVCDNVYGMCLVTVLDDNATSVDKINFSDTDGYFRVYTIQGVNVMTTKEKSDLNKLNPGLYIINRQKVIIR